MAWIGVLALMIGTMVTLSSIGAELNFRRSLELWRGLEVAHKVPALQADRPAAAARKLERCLARLEPASVHRGTGKVINRSRGSARRAAARASPRPTRA